MVTLFCFFFLRRLLWRRSECHHCVCGVLYAREQSAKLQIHHGPLVQVSVSVSSQKSLFTSHWHNRHVTVNISARRLSSRLAQWSVQNLFFFIFPSSSSQGPKAMLRQSLTCSSKKSWLWWRVKEYNWSAQNVVSGSAAIFVRRLNFFKSN